ncbi:unnamed protein product [Callosobruchus maculatus]|uniref:DDE Tnp4 domain-containing protein n=1 Tax=Callosobruchus maculatus TaxID=64391 RepID=A0A653C274_CALMS|nr:unnamed protein product [Callosobruchus maculatus]
MERLNFVDAVDILSSSSDSDSQDDRRPRIVRERNDLFESLDDIEFKRRFRLTKRTFVRLEGLLCNLPEARDNRNHPVSKRNQILICLRFFATGSFQITVGDLFHVSQPTVSRIITCVIEHIAALLPLFIQMPQTEQEMRDEATKFYSFGHLPNIIGAVDCTHIKIQLPGGNLAEVYRNRKGWFSINTQIIAGSTGKIMDIVARWPGSVRDTTIFNDSHIRARFESHHFGQYVLVGDSGYPCRVYLLTPIVSPTTISQQQYNTAHARTRNIVERLNGVWKRRFPCLSLGMRLKPEKVCTVIVATAVLHNICCIEHDLDDFSDSEVEEESDVPYVNVTDGNSSTRDALLTLF